MAATTGQHLGIGRRLLLAMRARLGHERVTVPAGWDKRRLIRWPGFNPIK
jgi:hypothetical protein